MKKEIKIVAIATDKADNAIIRKQGNGHYHWEYHTQYFTQEYLQQIYAKSFRLYATTSETPKEGDVIIYNNQIHHVVYSATVPQGEVLLSGFGYVTKSDCRKVVATDDKDLWITIPKGADYEKTINLPQISPEFQQAWVKNMNAETPIVDATMEMVDNGYKVDMEGRGGMDEGDTCWMPKIEVKLNPQGYVTILPVKEKMYNRKEIMDLFDLYNDDIDTFYNGQTFNRTNFDKFIQQNL